MITLTGSMLVALGFYLMLSAPGGVEIPRLLLEDGEAFIAGLVLIVGGILALDIAALDGTAD